MSFEVVHGSPQAIWVPISYAAAATTIYVGGIVAEHMDDVTAKDGVIMMEQASGAWNTTIFNVPFGVVIGTNLRDPVFNTTGKCEYITTASPHDSTKEYVLTGGPYIGGGHEAFAKVNVIDPCTVLKGSLVDSAVGTAPTVGTVTTSCGGDGVDCVTSAMSVATVAGFSTIYFRTGANKGTYRILDSASDTTHTWDTPCYADVAVGDTAVAVNVLPFGVSKVQLLATYSTCFDIDEAVTGAYFAIDVLRLDLAEQYKEYVEFRWNPINWAPLAGARA